MHAWNPASAFRPWCVACPAGAAPSRPAARRPGMPWSVPSEPIHPRRRGTPWPGGQARGWRPWSTRICHQGSLIGMTGHLGGCGCPSTVSGAPLLLDGDNDELRFGFGRFWTASTSAGDTPIEEAPKPATETLTLTLDSSPVALGGGSAHGWARAPCGPTLAYCMRCHRPAQRPRKRLSRRRRRLLGETEPNGSGGCGEFDIREICHRRRQQAAVTAHAGWLACPLHTSRRDGFVPPPEASGGRRIAGDQVDCLGLSIEEPGGATTGEATRRINAISASLYA